MLNYQIYYDHNCNSFEPLLKTTLKILLSYCDQFAPDQNSYMYAWIIFYGVIKCMYVSTAFVVVFTLLTSNPAKPTLQVEQ